MIFHLKYIPICFVIGQNTFGVTDEETDGSCKADRTEQPAKRHDSKGGSILTENYMNQIVTNLAFNLTTSLHGCSHSMQNAGNLCRCICEVNTRNYEEIQPCWK